MITDNQKKFIKLVMDYQGELNMAKVGKYTCLAYDRNTKELIAELRGDTLINYTKI